MPHRLLLALSGFAISFVVSAETASEYKTSLYFDAIKNQPEKLSQFLRDMPKGGDLHTHHSGATMAENMLTYAKGEGYCIDRNTWIVTSDAKCTSDNLLDNVVKQAEAYNAIIDAWSMRHFSPSKESGHDHFFAAFAKYSPIPKKFSAEIIAEIIERAAQQNEVYVELMLTPDNNASTNLGKEAGWNADFSSMREKLFAMGLKNILPEISKKLNEDEAKVKTLLECETPQAKKGCKITLRYQYQVKREQAPEQVFAQLLMGFEAASYDSRVVGINLVQPEDGVISMRDYDLQMRMIGFLHGLYPKVNVSLHAGELALGLVPREDLGIHVGKAVRIAQATRIGHGVDVVYEKQLSALLADMAEKNKLVEINLSSNEAILGISGKDHPILLYMQHNVPVALSTDDEGVLRTDLTEQYVKAVSSYQFSYTIVKSLARNSITYSFLPGQSLWKDRNYRDMHAACATDKVDREQLSSSCQDFLSNSEKATLQWKLEKQFSDFEKRL
jgi:adenosine deaminase